MKKIDKAALLYATALMNLCSDIHETENELDQVAELVKKDEGIWNFFRSQVIKTSEKVELLDRALKPHISDLMYGFLGLLAKKRRFDLLAQIRDAFSEQVDIRMGRRQVNVQSAVALDEKDKGEIEEALRKYLHRDIVINVRQQPDLIAGLVVQVGDLVIDNTVASGLKRLHASLLSHRILGEEYYEN